MTGNISREVVMQLKNNLITCKIFQYLLPLFCKTLFKCHLCWQSLVPAEDYEDEDEEVTRINGQGQTEGQEEEGEDKPEWGGKGGTISDNAYTGYGQILVHQLVST